MKTITRDYRFFVKRVTAEQVFTAKYCRLLASSLNKNSTFVGVSQRHRTLSIVPILECCFNWHESPEGYNFWYRIHCKLNKGINIHGEDIGTSDKEIDEALLIPF